MKPPFITALLIPTGIGASIGGFGGDAMTLLPLFAEICDTVITHPNVANAACFQTLPENTLYVEGYALDQFFKDNIGLQLVRANKIGILWDCGIPADMEILHQNAVAAVETVYGVNIVAWQETSKPVSLELITDPSGRSTGRINNPDVLLVAGQALKDAGATAIAVCCLMPEAPEEAEAQYHQGQGVDPIGGLEAMISHYLVSQLGIPCDTAPVFPWDTAKPVLDEMLDPRTAAEFIAPTFLPCVLTGLAKAPQLSPSGALQATDVSAIVCPADALGNIPALIGIEKNIPVLAVLENTSVMQTPAESLLAQSVIPCVSYREALGSLLALKCGLSCPF